MLLQHLCIAHIGNHLSKESFHSKGLVLLQLLQCFSMYRPKPICIEPNNVSVLLTSQFIQFPLHNIKPISQTATPATNPNTLAGVVPACPWLLLDAMARPNALSTDKHTTYYLVNSALAATQHNSCRIHVDGRGDGERWTSQRHPF